MSLTETTKSIKSTELTELTELTEFDNQTNKNDLTSKTDPDKNNNEKLGDRMKRYENEVDNRIIIKPCESFIIRLDGRSFSKFTKGFHKPFDIVFIKAMGFTTLDLIKEFEAQTGYSHSDEITLIFNSKCGDQEYFEYLEYLEKSKNNSSMHKDILPNHMFNGRVQKILSLVSSYCSVRFNYHLERLIENFKEQYEKKFINIVKSHQQMFDARMMIFEEDKKHEILNHQIWRSVHDCSRNAISTYAHYFFGPKRIMNKNTHELVQMMRDEKNFDWDDSDQVPTFIKHGLYCKKTLVEKVIEGNTVLRSEYVFKQHKINFTQENLNILMNKYWNISNDLNNLEDWNEIVNLDNLDKLKIPDKPI